MVSFLNKLFFHIKLLKDFSGQPGEFSSLLLVNGYMCA